MTSLSMREINDLLYKFQNHINKGDNVPFDKNVSHLWYNVVSLALARAGAGLKLFVDRHSEEAAKEMTRLKDAQKEYADQASKTRVLKETVSSVMLLGGVVDKFKKKLEGYPGVRDILPHDDYPFYNEFAALPFDVRVASRYLKKTKKISKRLQEMGYNAWVTEGLDFRSNPSGDWMEGLENHVFEWAVKGIYGDFTTALQRFKNTLVKVNKVGPGCMSFDDLRAYTNWLTDEETLRNTIERLAAESVPSQQLSKLLVYEEHVRYASQSLIKYKATIRDTLAIAEKAKTFEDIYKVCDQWYISSKLESV